MKDVLIYSGLISWFICLVFLWAKWLFGFVQEDHEEGAICVLTVLWWAMVFII